jgi:hypothetical protein
MIYVKSLLTGLGALIAATFLAVVVRVVVLILKVRMSSGGGIGAIAGPGWPVLVVSLLAFVAGFFWQYLRLSRKG